MREEVEARDRKDKDYVQEPENFPTGNSAEYCGMVLRLDSLNNKAFIKFLEEESEDHGWYPIGKEMRKCYGHTCGSETTLALTEIALVEGKRVKGRKVKKGVPSKKEVKGTMTTTRAPQGHCWI
jgi:hypothetical protein